MAAAIVVAPSPPLTPPTSESPVSPAMVHRTNRGSNEQGSRSQPQSTDTSAGSSSSSSNNNSSSEDSNIGKQHQYDRIHGSSADTDDGHLADRLQRQQQQLSDEDRGNGILGEHEDVSITRRRLLEAQATDARVRADANESKRDSWECTSPIKGRTDSDVESKTADDDASSPLPLRGREEVSAFVNTIVSEGLKRCLVRSPP